MKHLKNLYQTLRYYYWSTRFELAKGEAQWYDNLDGTMGFSLFMGEEQTNRGFIHVLNSFDFKICADQFKRAVKGEHDKV